MAPNKRRRSSASTEHHGRVTVPRDPTVLPRASTPSPATPRIDAASRSEPLGSKDQSTTRPPASRRYTPPKKSVRYRPGWHKAVGACILLAGIAIIVLNDAMRLEPSWTLLPGGHQEAYLALGVIVAAFSTRWFGWFDRAK